MSDNDRSMGEKIKDAGHDAVQKTKEFFGAEKETAPGRMKDKAEDVKDWANEKKEDIKDYGKKVNQEVKD